MFGEERFVHVGSGVGCDATPGTSAIPKGHLGGFTPYGESLWFKVVALMGNRYLAHHEIIISSFMS